jgi:hypothetical protein
MSSNLTSNFTTTTTTLSPFQIYFNIYFANINFINTLNAISKQFTWYTAIIVIVVGIVGNLISLYIYTRPELNKKTNTGFLYGWLCMLSIYAICIYAFIYLNSQFGGSVFGYSVNLNTPCGMFFFVIRTAYYSTSWMQILISFDRFVCVCYPTKAALMSKKVCTFYFNFIQTVRVIFE